MLFGTVTAAINVRGFQMKRMCAVLGLLMIVLLTGCFGGDDGSSPTVPTKFVSLKGTVTAPGQIESSLLGSVVNNSETGVRDAFKAASIWVNGFPAASCTIDSSNGTSWPVRVYNVPENAQGKYNLQVIAGRLILKSNILATERDNFVISTETTAAALLAETLKTDQKMILASYPAIVNSLKADLLSAARKSPAELGLNLVKSGLIETAVKKYKGYLDAIGDLKSVANLAYLQKENDLDGDGVIDLQIVQLGGGQRIRFFTALATATSLLENTASLDIYSDDKVLQDFNGHQTSEGNTFAAADKDFTLGLFFKRSALADQYVKVLVRRIDLNSEGVFSGVVAEYKYISTGTTAIVSGTKTLQLLNGSSVEGAVAATDFISDSFPGDYNLTYISTALGIGCYSGNQMLVALIDGQPDLEKLSSVPKITSGVYFSNTAAALKDLKTSRALELGDVFGAYFPTTRHYALFKIRQVDSYSITVDYKVNSTPDEPRF